LINNREIEKTREEWALDMKEKGKAICIFCEYYSPLVE